MIDSPAPHGNVKPIHILAFVADPLSTPAQGGAPRLELDYEVRQIQEKLRAARYRDAVRFDVRWAAHTDDLLQALNETPPQIVHFSGHGDREGLVLVGKDGRPYRVDGKVLAQLFEIFKADLRVVLLSACMSLAHTEAIAEVVGCAIGTRDKLFDAAAITFGASFYRAIAFGSSVKAAHAQGCAALAMDRVAEDQWPVLKNREDVDPAQLVLIPHPGESAGPWRDLLALLVRLYPSGPREYRVWERAGGDVSRLPSDTNPRTAWFDAVSLMKKGGGGATLESLLHEVGQDYPLDADVPRLAGLAYP